MERRRNSGPDNPCSQPTDRKQDSGPATQFTALLEHACPAVTERRPTSGPDTPIDALLEHQTADRINTASLEREGATQYRMIVCWDGPRYPGLCFYTWRQRSFQKRAWSHKTLSTQALSAAGVFFTGNDLCIRVAKQTNNTCTHSILRTHITVLHILTGHAHETRCFHCGGGFRGWQDEDSRGGSIHPASRTLSTSVIFAKGRHSTLKKRNVLWCNVIYLFEDNKLEYLKINVSFYSFTVVPFLPNNNNTKCSCTYFICGLGARKQRQ